MADKQRHPLLVLVGMAGSGKSVAADIVKQAGWQIVYFGGVTLDELKARGLEVTPTNERVVREELRRTHGPEAYAKLSHPRIAAARAQGPTAIDGLYSWAEYKYVRQHLGEPMTVVCVYTPRALRYQRLAQRTFRPLTAQQALDRDLAEIENLDKGGPIAMADHVIVNDGDHQALARRLRQIMDDLSKAPQ